MKSFPLSIQFLLYSVDMEVEDRSYYYPSQCNHCFFLKLVQGYGLSSSLLPLRIFILHEYHVQIRNNNLIHYIARIINIKEKTSVDNLAIQRSMQLGTLNPSPYIWNNRITKKNTRHVLYSEIKDLSYF